MRYVLISLGPPNVGQQSGEANGMRGERIHLRQNKGDRSLFNAPQGHRGQDGWRETVWKDRGWRLGVIFKEGGWGGMVTFGILAFLVTVPHSKSHWSVRAYGYFKGVSPDGPVFIQLGIGVTLGPSVFHCSSLFA